MWSRYELKQQAKSHLFTEGWRPFWNGVLMALVSFAIVGFVTAILTAPLNAPRLIEQISAALAHRQAVTTVDTAQTEILRSLLGKAVAVFLTLPLGVGVCRYFLNARQGGGHFDDLFYAFKDGHYLPVLAATAWWELFLTLWSLLRDAPDLLLRYTAFANVSGNLALIALNALWQLCALALMIPFIVKSIAYSMTGYILSDNPNIGFRRALRLSQQMTRGHKGGIFVLYLSFIGWALLGVLCVVVGLLGVYSYFKATEAELYARLRDAALRQGYCSYEELRFLPPAAV